VAVQRHRGSGQQLGILGVFGHGERIVRLLLRPFRPASSTDGEDSPAQRIVRSSLPASGPGASEHASYHR
jgi:hypothetical protein